MRLLPSRVNIGIASTQVVSQSTWFLPGILDPPPLFAAIMLSSRAYSNRCCRSCSQTWCRSSSIFFNVSGKGCR
jgi:hypothetical protein